MMRKKIAAGLLLLVVLFLPVAGEKQAEIPAPRDFGFGTMEIFEFSNFTSDLLVYDMNRDGLDDILFLNNKVSRLEILTRKAKTKKQPDDPSAEGEAFPELDERFTNNGFVLDNWIQDFHISDFNGDKLPDVATIDEQRGIRIYFQQARQGGGTFAEPVSLPVKEVTKLKGFETGDLNGDGSIDIFAYSQENADIFSNNGRGEFKTQTTLDFATYGCQGAMIADIDGDRLQDILLYFPKASLSLRVRRGKGDGQFGWEEALEIPNMRSMEKMDLSASGACQMGMILRNGLIFRLYEFESRAGKPLFEENEAVPRRLPLRGISRKRPPTWVVADIDGDGFDDFCAAAPMLNQVHLYKGSATGLNFTPTAVDSLRDIQTIAITGRGDLVVFSEAEKAIAVHANKKLTAFPEFLRAEGEPVAMSAAGESTVFALFKNKDTFTLNLFNTGAIGKGPFKSLETGVRNVPSDMKAFPLDGKDHWGIMFFMPYDKPVMVRLLDGTLYEVTPDRFRALGASLKPREVTAVGTQNGQALLVTEGNAARHYRWKQDRFVVEEQLNPGVESARLIAGCLSCTGDRGYLLYDEAGQEIYRFLPSPDQKPSHIHVEDGVDDLTGIASLRLKKNYGILLVGQSEIQWVQGDTPSLYLKNIGEYVSRMEKPSLWDLFPVSLGSPGRPMAAMLDSRNRSVEVVGFKDGKLEEELVFEVFQDPGFNNQMAENNYEPHDLGNGDFNGDNIRDIAVLVHNKLIIYLGE